MTNLIRWDPFTDISPGIDRFFEENFMRPWRMFRSVEETTSFPIEVSETENEVEVKASLPGVDPENINIQVHDDLLMIKAETRKEEEEKKKNYYRQEIRYGQMQRAISLPSAVQAENAQAQYEDGVLRLTLPKSESARPKQIPVRAAGSRQTIEGSSRPVGAEAGSQPQSYSGQQQGGAGQYGQQGGQQQGSGGQYGQQAGQQQEPREQRF